MRLTRRERDDGRLTSDDESAVYAGITELTERIAPKLPVEAGPVGGLTLAVPSHHRGEELLLTMMRHLLKPTQLDVASTRLLPVEIEALIQEKQPAVLFLAILPPGGLVQARYLCRRLKKMFPELKIVVCYFGRARNFDRLLVRLRSAGATYVMTSLLQSRKQILSLNPVTPLQKTV